MTRGYWLLQRREHLDRYTMVESFWDKAARRNVESKSCSLKRVVSPGYASSKTRPASPPGCFWIGFPT